MGRTSGRDGHGGRLALLLVATVLCARSAWANEAPPAEAPSGPRVEQTLTAAQINGGLFIDLRLGGQLGLSELAASGFRVDVDGGYQFESGLGLVVHTALGFSPEAAFDAWSELELVPDGEDDSFSDYFELHGGLRHSWLLIDQRVRLTAQGSYGLAGYPRLGLGHGFNVLGQLDYRFHQDVSAESTLWVGLSAGCSAAMQKFGDVAYGSLAVTLHGHM